MDLREFHESGLLAYANSSLWPLGIALTVLVEDDGTYSELFVQRLDPYEPIVSGDSPEEQEARADALARWLNRRVRTMAEVDKAPYESDVTEDTKKVLGDQQTKTKSDPKGDVTAERTEKQVVRGTIKPDKKG
jgi:hypothetical protein